MALLSTVTLLLLFGTVSLVLFSVVLIWYCCFGSVTLVLSLLYYYFGTVTLVVVLGSVSLVMLFPYRYSDSVILVLLPW